ncbi:MAG: hypothetical protein R3B96_00175 [Pirellulaceae bacterium]
MSAIAESTDVVVEPRRGPRLGPKGLAAFTILIFAATLGIVAVAVLCFPEVIDEQLPVTILVDGYIAPEEVDASVKRYQEGTGEVLEPYDGAKRLRSAAHERLYAAQSQFHLPPRQAAAAG